MVTVPAPTHETSHETAHETSHDSLHELRGHNIETLDLIRAVARIAASDIAARSLLRSSKAKRDLADQFEGEFTACFGYWDLYFASGGDRVPKSAIRPKPAKKKTSAIKLLPRRD